MMASIEAPVARFWMAAARSHRVEPDDWKAWADALIEKSELPSDWVIKMSLANSRDELRAALSERLQTEQPNEVEDDDAVLGHIWARYENEKISLAECLRKAGEEADSSSATVECEEIYSLLSELEGAGDENEVRVKAAALLFRVREIAERQWTSLLAGDP